ncbi:HMG1/2-like protein [Hordeum vulgare]|nr:HMG1/2-like protein [Hordeum vulgare]
MTVSMFGDWDMQNGAIPDYSMDFSKIWEMYKQNKKELSRASLIGDDDLLAHHKVAVKKSKAEKDPNKPKRPPSAFFIFMDTFMKEYMEKHPNVKKVFVIIIVHLVIANSYLQTQAKMYLLMQY